MAPFRLPTAALLCCASAAGLLIPSTAAADIPDGAPLPGTGGSLGVAEPPPAVLLSRSTYYVGEVITGSVDCPACYPEGPTFMDELGNPLSGTFTYSATDPGHFVFVPDPDLALGNYSVSLDFGATSFSVVEGEPAEPTYALFVSESKTGAGTPLACQSAAEGTAQELYPQTLVRAVFQVMPQGESSDQYQFEALLSGESERQVVPDPVALAVYEEDVGEICVQVFALPHAGGMEVALGQSCVDPAAKVAVGVRDEPFGSLDALLRTCELPPDGHFEAWCAVFAEAFTRHSCDGFLRTPCNEARYECPDGDLPEWYEENGIDPENPEGAEPPEGAPAPTNSPDGETSEAGGCSCRIDTRPSRSGSLWWLALLGSGLVIARRRRSARLVG